MEWLVKKDDEGSNKVFQAFPCCEGKRTGNDTKSGQIRCNVLVEREPDYQEDPYYHKNGLKKILEENYHLVVCHIWCKIGFLLHQHCDKIDDPSQQPNEDDNKNSFADTV